MDIHIYPAMKWHEIAVLTLAMNTPTGVIVSDNRRDGAAMVHIEGLHVAKRLAGGPGNWAASAGLVRITDIQDVASVDDLVETALTTSMIRDDAREAEAIVRLYSWVSIDGDLPTIPESLRGSKS